MSHSALGFESSDLDDDGGGGYSFGDVALSYAPFPITGYPPDFKSAPPKDGSTSADAHPRLRAELNPRPWMKPQLIGKKNMSPRSANVDFPMRKGKAYCVACRCRVAVHRLEYHRNSYGHQQAEQKRNAEMLRASARLPAPPQGFLPPPPQGFPLRPPPMPAYFQPAFRADIQFNAIQYPLYAPRPLPSLPPQAIPPPQPHPPLFGHNFTGVVLGLFPCPKCPAAFNCHADVVKHVEDRSHIVHYGPTKVFPDCSFCGMTFESCASRNRHMNETKHEFCVNYTSNHKKSTRLLNVAETPFWTQLRHLRSASVGQFGANFSSTNPIASTSSWNSGAATSTGKVANGNGIPKKKSKKLLRRERRERDAVNGVQKPPKKKKKKVVPSKNAAAAASSAAEKNRNSKKKQRKLENAPHKLRKALKVKSEPA